MIACIPEGVYWLEGGPRTLAELAGREVPAPEAAAQGTMAAAILCSHSADPKALKIRFDKLISHDITYVGIVQTARASGLSVFPVPYALTNCHNSLCSEGGTINEDDHRLGL